VEAEERVRLTVKNFLQSRLGKSEIGQAMVEFSLTISMTLLLIFGLIDFSRAVYTASIIQWAAQNGARAAIIEPSQEVVVAAVKERLVALDPDAVVVAPISWTGNVVFVEVTYPFEFVAPIVAQIAGEAIEMTSSASMIAY
jgi:Flp pilus assembly protein TadG